MTFQASDFKRNHLLDLLDNNYLSIKPTYMKDGTQLKLLDHSNSLCARVTNHIPIGKYHLSLFPNKNFNCLCRLYPIKSRHYILYEYRRFNNYWNPNREFLIQMPFSSMKESLGSSFVMISRSQSRSRRETLYRVYTRELNRELYTGLSTLYTETPQSVLLYFQPNINSHMFALRSTCIIHAL